MIPICSILYYNIIGNMTICGRVDSECIKNVKIQMRMGRNDSFKCDCPYGCHAIKYEMSLSSTPMFPHAPLLKRYNLTVENTGILYVCDRNLLSLFCYLLDIFSSSRHVYYQSSYYRSQNKEEVKFKMLQCWRCLHKVFNIFINYIYLIS